MSQGGYIHLQVAGGVPGKGIQEGQMKPDEAQGWNPVRLPGDPIFYWLDVFVFFSFSQGQCKL